MLAVGEFQAESSGGVEVPAGAGRIQDSTKLSPASSAAFDEPRLVVEPDPVRHASALCLERP